jgi:ribosomal protein S4E
MSILYTIPFICLYGLLESCSSNLAYHSRIVQWVKIGQQGTWTADSVPGRNILVHVITVIVKVHFAIFIAINRRGTLAPVLELKIIFHTRYRVRYRVRYWGRSKKILCIFDIVSISKENLRYRVRYSKTIATLFVHAICIRYRNFIRYRVQKCITISGYKDIKGKNFDGVHDIGAMSG